MGRTKGEEEGEKNWLKPVLGDGRIDNNNEK